MKRLATLTATLLALTIVPIALASGGLAGKFKTTVAGHGAKTEHGQLDGTWTLAFGAAASGKVKLRWNGHVAGGGRYLISGSTITLTPKKTGQCKTKGRYTFDVTGGKLRFTLIKDACTVRRDILTYGAWTTAG